MISRKNIGGPKTPQGKRKVSRNATKHGLSTMKPTDASEQTLIKNFSQELISFYKPSSPLEFFQIERIAICRAKLAKLYEVEDTRLQLAQEEFSQDPRLIMVKLKGIEEITKGMLLEKIRYGACRLPLGLKAADLEKIASEIHRFSGKITNEHIFSRGFPVLTMFLRSLIEADQLEGIDLEKKLNQACERIEKVFNEGDKYHEFFLPLIDELFLLRKSKEKVQSRSNEAGLSELDEYNARRDIERKAEWSGYRKTASTNTSPAPVAPAILTNHEAIMKKLTWFTRIWDCYQGLDAAMVQFESIKELMLKAITLPCEESDLFMRYQTTLERRLSVTIGELLELQKMKKHLSK